MARAVPHNQRGAQVIDLSSLRKRRQQRSRRLLRLAPELDGLSLLYSNRHSGQDRLFAMKLLAWGLRCDGEVVGLLPWLNRLVTCADLDDPETGQFEGYYDPVSEDVFQHPPSHKVLELQGAVRYFGADANADAGAVLQEIPDTIGTHAMLVEPDGDSLMLAEVLSWRLCGDGGLHAMLVDDEAVDSTPVLPGDDCLYRADDNPLFRYFFQHHIANQIKARDPVAMEAIALLLDP